MIQRMPFEEYHATPGLSASGLSDLLVSPLRFWHLHINPNREPEEPTACQQFGTALHTAVLEPEHFEERYCERFNGEEIEGALDTIGDMREWLEARGFKPKGTRKADVIAQVLARDPTIPIIDVLKAEHDQRHEGKIQFNRDAWYRIGGAAQALRSEPKLYEMLHHPGGEREVSYFATHPETGVLLKARMDWVTPDVTLDLKTFSNSREKPIDKAVTDAIWFEGYYRKGYFYSLVRALEAGGTMKDAQTVPPFVLAFVESDPPHEVRIRELHRMDAGSPSMLWERARIEVNQLIQSYAYHQKRYGDRPWKAEQDIETLTDAEFPALAYGG